MIQSIEFNSIEYLSWDLVPFLHWLSSFMLFRAHRRHRQGPAWPCSNGSKRFEHLGFNSLLLFRPFQLHQERLALLPLGLPAPGLVPPGPALFGNWQRDQ